MGKDFVEYVQKRQAKYSPAEKAASIEIKYAMFVAGMVLKARFEKNLTQKELSDLSGVQQADISRIECAHTTPNTATFLRLLEAMGYQIEISPIRKNRKSA